MIETAMHPIRLVWMALCVLALAGCNTAGGSAPMPGGAVQEGAQADLRMVTDLPSPTPLFSGGAQPVSVADTLEISVFQVPDLSRTVQVGDSGAISLPLIGHIPAAGKSLQALQHDIESAYGAQYLQSPSVSVLLKDSAARRVTVDGEVARSGIYPLPPSPTLIDAVALAGGMSGVADPTKVFMFREIGGVTHVANYNLSDIHSGRRANPPVHGGDVVVVFPSRSRVAFRNLREALGVATSAGRLAVLNP